MVAVTKAPVTWETLLFGVMANNLRHRGLSPGKWRCVGFGKCWRKNAKAVIDHPDVDVGYACVAELIDGIC